MTDRRPPGAAADERGTLLGFLDYLRDAVAAKVDGVPDPQVREPGVPSGTNLLGLVKHLTAVERFYFQGATVRNWAATFTPAPADTAEGLLAAYREAVAASNAVAAGYDDLTRPVPNAKSSPSMRWLLTHMVEETARHAGHADIIRERLDGATGR